MSKGCLYLIPSPLSDSPVSDVLPAKVLDIISQVDCYVVEELRTARRFLSAAGRRGQIESIEFHVLNEHTSERDVESFASLFDEGRNVGLISEAGLPAVADPGASLVALAHRIGVKVVPLTGPSSLMMALMSSGLCGQSFSFNGYLPAKSEERKNALVQLEKTSSRSGQSQIFIETPYRSEAMLGDILSSLKDDTMLCVASNLTATDEEIISKRISEWKKSKTTLGKRPSVFILSAWKECSL